MKKFTEKELDVLFDLWYDRFDYNEETEAIYNALKAKGMTEREVLDEIFGKRERHQ